MRLRILQAEQQLPRRQQQRTALGAHSAAHLWAGWGGIPCISTSPLTALHSAALLPTHETHMHPPPLWRSFTWLDIELRRRSGGPPRLCCR